MPVLRRHRRSLGPPNGRRFPGACSGRHRSPRLRGPGACNSIQFRVDAGIGGEFNAGDGGVGVKAHATGAGGLAGEFWGDVHVTGKLTRAYTSVTKSQATPIAYAAVTSGGPTISGASTPNVTSSFDSVNKRYVITIASESYDINNFATTVTPIGSTTPRFASTQSSGGKLLVKIFDLTGAAVQGSFALVTFKP